MRILLCEGTLTAKDESSCWLNLSVLSGRKLFTCETALLLVLFSSREACSNFARGQCVSL